MNDDGALLTWWKGVRASYWFIPALMCVAAIGLAYLIPYFDNLIREQGTNIPGWVYGGGVQGARSLLATIAGSMITVASLTFSITLVALSSAAQQYGPRLLTHFMTDAGYQVTLGIFVATFLYCVLILRQVQDVGETPSIPRLAVTIAVVLAIASLAMLIYFIHHAASSLHPDDLVRRIGSDLKAAVNKRSDGRQKEESGENAGDGQNGNDATDRGRPSDERGREVTNEQGERRVVVLVSRETGYLQRIDRPTLKRLAKDNDLFIAPLHKPGEYVVEGSSLIEVTWPAGTDPETRDKLLDAFAFGSDSFPKGDIEVAISQLVEVAVRAISPSLNNPSTAIGCIDELETGLSRLAQSEAKPPESPSLSAGDQEDGSSRFRPPRSTFAELVGAAFDQIRHYARGMPSVNLRLMHALVTLSTQVRDAKSRDALLEQGELIARAADQLPVARDRRSLAHLQAILIENAERRR